MNNMDKKSLKYSNRKKIHIWIAKALLKSNKAKVDSLRVIEKQKSY